VALEKDTSKKKTNKGKKELLQSHFNKYLENYG
jgi:hypothetical protein